MDELWTLRPVMSMGKSTIRPVRIWSASGTIRPMSTFLSEEEFNYRFKDRLVGYRKAMRQDNGRSWTQEQMAEALGVAGTTYCKWEQHTSPNNFPRYLLPRLAEVTGHDLWTILTDQGAKFSPEKRQNG